MGQTGPARLQAGRRRGAFRGRAAAGVGQRGCDRSDRRRRRQVPLAGGGDADPCPWRYWPWSAACSTASTPGRCSIRSVTLNLGGADLTWTAVRSRCGSDSTTPSATRPWIGTSSRFHTSSTCTARSSANTTSISQCRWSSADGRRPAARVQPDPPGRETTEHLRSAPRKIRRDQHRQLRTVTTARQIPDLRIQCAFSADIAHRVVELTWASSAFSGPWPGQGVQRRARRPGRVPRNRWFLLVRAGDSK